MCCSPQKKKETEEKREEKDKKGNTLDPGITTNHLCHHHIGSTCLSSTFRWIQ